MNPVLVAGAIAGALLIPALYLLATLLRIEVEEGEAVLVTRFGKLAEKLDAPGWHLITGTSAHRSCRSTSKSNGTKFRLKRTRRCVATVRRKSLVA